MRKRDSKMDKSEIKYVFEFNDYESLDPEKIKEMENEAEEKIVSAKVYLLMKYPYIGEIGTRLENVPTWRIPTAATCGRKLYYNPAFILSLSERKIIFTVAHEILHVLLDHVFRRGDRQPYVWNVAIDYITNYILVKEKIGEIPFPEIYYKEEYSDEKWTAETLYDHLLDSHQMKIVVFDIHLDNSPDNDSQGGEKTQISVEVVGGKSLSEEEINKLRNEIKAQIANSKSFQAGNIPAGIKRIIDEFNNPEINWKHYILSKILEYQVNDYNFARPHNQSWVKNIIIPSVRNVEEKFHLHVYIDASGSINDKMLKEFFSEIVGICNNIGMFEITINSFDTEAYEICKINNFEYNLSDLKEKIKDCKGGGGTMFGCIFEDLSKNKNYQNSTVIVFTDGYCFDDWGEKNLNKMGGMSVFQDVIFVLKNTELNMKAPFGRTLHMKND